MTESADNTELIYTQAIAAIRLMRVRDLESMPRDDEPVDIVVLAALGGMRAK